MSTDHVYNLIILDESGSMDAIKSATISGFNEVVQTIRGIETQYPEQKHYISLVTFNGMGVRTKLDRQPVSILDAINANTYRPDASTPLYDAIGISTLRLKMDIAGIPGANVLVTILTDGEENASREFTGADVKRIIDELKAMGWTFTYIGANHDVEKVAASLSIKNTMTFKSTDHDVHRMFEQEKSARMNYSQKIREKTDTSEDFYK